jgi:hypothetical protein
MSFNFGHLQPQTPSSTTMGMQRSPGLRSLGQLGMGNAGMGFDDLQLPCPSPRNAHNIFR